MLRIVDQILSITRSRWCNEPFGGVALQRHARRLHASHMAHRLSQADRREFIGEMNIFTLINLVLSRLVQSSQSYVVRGDNEALFFRAARFSLLFFFQTTTENTAFTSRPKATAFPNTRIQPILHWSRQHPHLVDAVDRASI